MMVTMRVSLEGAEEVRRALRDPALIKGPLKDLLVSAAILVEAEAKQRVPVDTGRLRSSITSAVAPFQASVGTNVTYAPFVELGTEPHEIRPRNKKALAFQLGGKLGRGTRRRGLHGPIGGGQRIVVARVEHPGTRPHPFMRPAAEKLRREAPSLLHSLATAIETFWARRARRRR